MQTFLKYVHGSLDLIPKTPHKVYGIKFFVVKLDHNAPMHNDKVVQLSQQYVRYSKHIGWTKLNDQLNKLIMELDHKKYTIENLFTSL